MLKQFLTTLMMVLLISFVSFGQFTKNTLKQEGEWGLELSFEGTLDTIGGTTDTVTSVMFVLDDFDAELKLELSYLLTSVGALTPCIDVKLYGSDYSTAYASMVSLATLLDSVVIETEGATSQALDGIRKKYYRMLIYNWTGGSGVTFKLKLKATKRDF